MKRSQDTFYDRQSVALGRGRKAFLYFLLCLSSFFQIKADM
ncbi:MULTISPECIES: hypothetical protein [Anaerobutyricum]|nr:hypothetical protein [Anaerobutyricum hallii]